MAGFAYYVIQRNDAINDSIFHMSNGMQGAYSKMIGVVRILFGILTLKLWAVIKWQHTWLPHSRYNPQNIYSRKLYNYQPFKTPWLDQFLRQYQLFDLIRFVVNNDMKIATNYK